MREWIRENMPWGIVGIISINAASLILLGMLYRKFGSEPPTDFFIWAFVIIAYLDLYYLFLAWMSYRQGRRAGMREVLPYLRDAVARGKRTVDQLEEALTALRAATGLAKEIFIELEATKAGEREFEGRLRIVELEANRSGFEAGLDKVKEWVALFREHSKSTGSTPQAIKEPFGNSDQDKTWEGIEDKGWDREAVKLLCSGYTDSEIANKLNESLPNKITPKTVTNRFTVLRSLYPGRVPTRDQVKRQSLKDWDMLG